MQEKSTPHAKTPGKKNRKSIANSSPNKQNGVDKTPVSKKNAEGKFPLTPFVKAVESTPAATPNKKKAAKTPKQNVENTPKAESVVSPALQTPNTAGGKQKRRQSVSATADELSSPAKQQKPADNAGGKQKRKQSLAAAEAESASPPKQQKPADNAGGKQKRKQSAVTNGDGSPSPKQQKLEKFPGTTKLDNSAATPEGKAQKKKDKLANRKKRRNAIKEAFVTLKEGGQLSPTFLNSVQSAILKFEALATQKKLSKSANRKLATYRKLQKLIGGKDASNTKTQKQAAAPKQKQEKGQAKKGKEGKNQKAKNVKVAKVEEEDEDDEESDAEEESEDEDVENESGEEESDDDEAEEESDEEEEEDNSPKPVANKKQHVAVANKKQNEGKGEQGNKSRYVLFVGNLPYDATKEEITEHFSKVANVRDLRMIDRKGFGHVELADQQSYEVS